MKAWILAAALGSESVRPHKVWKLGHENLPDLPFQLGDVPRCRLPDERPREAEVLVNHDVAKRDDVGPWNRWMTIPHRAGDTRGRLADHRQFVKHGCA